MYADKLYHRFLKTVSKHSREITPKKVHLLRTTSRRLQMALATSAEGDDKLHRQLRKIRRQAGRVRDLDVQLASLKTIDLPSTAAEQKRVKRALERMRERRARKLGQFLSVYTPSLRRPKRQSPESQPDRNPTRHPLWAALDSFASAAEKFSGGTDSDLHAFRIAAKKARYTAELAPKESHSASVIAALKAIQDAIGQWHDWSILSESAAHVLGNPPHSALLNLLHKRVRIRLARARRVTMENTQRLAGLRAALAERAALPTQKKRPASVTLRERAASAL